MKILALALTVCAAALMSMSEGIQSCTVFVDAKAAAGGDGTTAKPFRSPFEARDLLRKARGSELKPATVRIAAGDYYLDAAFSLDHWDSNVHFEGAGNVRFTRALKVVPGEKVDCDVPPLPDSEGYSNMRPHAPMFFYDSQWAVDARWPNEGWATFSETIDSGIRGRCLDSIAPDNAPVAGSFRLNSERPAKWNFSEGVYIAGYFTHDWSFERIRASEFDASNHVMRMAGPANYGIGGKSWSEHKERRFFVYGVRSEMDAPGEYFYDRKSKKVDFIAPDGMKEFLAVTKEGPLVSMTGADGVRFSGIVFEYAVNCGLLMQNCHSVEVKECKVCNVGGNGIVIEGGKNCRIVNTKISGCGFRGIMLTAGDRKQLVKAGHRVEGCEISDFSRICRTYAPAFAVQGCGIEVVRNRIFDAPHSGVIYGGNEHLFESNEVFNILYESGDAGAFYTGRDPTSRGNVLRFNYVHDCGRLSGKAANTMGFYLDDCDAGDTLVSNRVVNVPRGLMLGGGHDNHIVGNIFERCNIGMSVDARGTVWKDKWDSPTDKTWQMTRKVKEMNVTEEPWRSKYPLLVKYLEDGPKEPRHISIIGNLFINCKTPIQYSMNASKYKHLMDMRDNGFEDRKSVKDAKSVDRKY